MSGDIRTTDVWREFRALEWMLWEQAMAELRIEILKSIVENRRPLNPSPADR